MLKTYLYIPDHLDKQINYTAKTQKKSKAEVLREAIKEGLDQMEKRSRGGTELLLELAEMARKRDIKGPKDLSVNHDYYLWGGKKRNPRAKP